METNWQKIESKIKTLDALRHAQAKIMFDQETVAPAESFEKTGKTLGTLATMYHQEMTDKVFNEALTAITEAEVSELQWKMIEKLRRDVNKISKIPEAEYSEYTELLSLSHAKWIEAREANDYAIFEPILEKVVTFQKRYILWQGYEVNPYDALLDDYEPGLTVADLDTFFDTVRQQLVPYLQKILSYENLKAFKKQGIGQGTFDLAKQKELMNFLLEYVGYDFSRGMIAESEHPFSDSYHNDDARVTTKYKVDDVSFAIFSVLHEFGHAEYELNIADEITQTPLGEGVSMGIHESQSRFYENIIGRSQAFWQPIYPVLQAFFPDVYSKVSLEQFIQSVNVVEPSLIRIEADELTYPLHIMVRYDLEKQLFNDEITVAELPKAWNAKMKEYLGIEPTCMKDGVLQDIHWSQGSFGYFPTYALGSAYAAQFNHTLHQQVAVEESLLQQNVAPITAFFAENIHQYGASKMPKELIMDTTNEAFNSQYYIDYLTEKYDALFKTEK